MPKMKSNSGAKKRFRATGTGKVRANQAGKQHMMRRRSNAAIRNLRGTTILGDDATKVVIKLLPYFKKHS